VRHFFNPRNQGPVVWAISISAAIGVAALAVAIYPRQAAAPARAVTFAQAQAIINQRCVPCHSASPVQPGYDSAPYGVTFDTPQQITARAGQIYQQAVVTSNMPFGNLTNITQDERSALGDWYQAGAPGP
jgi:uncharacterized membrane protein